MKFLCSSKIRLVLVGFTVALVICSGGSAKAEFIFGTPTNLGPTVNSSAWDNEPSISADGLSLFFHSERGGGFGGEDIWVTTRATKADPWGTPVNLGPTVNSSSHDFCPCISADDLSLSFTSDRPGGYGFYDLWVTRRATKEDPWGTPVNLGPTVNSSADEWDPYISADGLSLYFASYYDIWVTRRVTIDDDWGPPENLGPPLNTSYGDSGPNISADGLSFFFESNRPGGYGDYDVWATTRETKDDPWDTPVNLGPMVNSSAHESGVRISRDGLALYFTSNQPGGYGRYDVWVTTRETTDDEWCASVNLGPTVNSSADDAAEAVSTDGLALFFSSDRPGGYGNRDLYVTKRQTTDDPWGEPVNLGPTVNSASTDYVPSISADGRTLFFGSDRPGGVGSYDLWQVSITLVIDFNGDGRIDFKDFSLLALYWLQEESLVDIAPPPLGDDMVDLKDIVVFAENWLVGTRRASNPHPWNGATNVDINADLSWTAGVEATSHDVYFGTTNPPTFIRNQAATTYDPGTMAEGTGHYWRIDEVGDYGTTTGTLWRFTSGWGGPPP